ncbi:ABC transporter ATP-binding protein [Paenibacillus filicis]|uniref:ABC transporter ATP-binding protein n=1 Tax=Paenibacillus gyeongsangnamensis TaxID=3388067 RepID=A0ABT4Q528_9BACL|nr:ABC transporter ATP-binding protein [Paenibacillus filicis]MCZ8511897.1 ABC transporter ATP-binding protein [Paenibacillus filicis]
MHFLLPYVRKYWKLFCLAVLFLTLEALADLLQPTIMARIIDVGVAARQLDYVLHMGGLMLLITAMGALAASARNILASRVSQKFGAELRLDLFRKIQTLSFNNIDKFERASLVTRLTNDVTQVQNFTNGLMRIFVKAPLLCIGSLIMAVRLNLQLAAVLAVVVPVVGVLIALNMKIGFPRFIKVQKALDQVNGVMREYLSGVRVVKAFNRFDYEVEKFGRTNDEYRSLSTMAMRAMAIFNPLIMLAVNLGIVTVIWLGGLGVSSGYIQVGHIIAFINYMTQILFSLMMISMVLNMFVRAKASAGRIGEVFQEHNEMTWSERVEEEAPAARGRIDFEDVSFAYEGAAGEPVLRHVTFSCLPGETVGIIGSTGSGKTSLVSLVPRFYDVTAGVVKVNGVDVKETDPRRLREMIAVVPQKTVLFTGTVTENIRWGKDDASLEEIEQAARMAQAHDFIRSVPEGYDAYLGQGGVNFSGGQKQRLSIARALVRQPDVLILDDCTSAVDVATEGRIKEALKQYASGITCLLIAQRITSVMDADKIVVLDQGEVVGLGSHGELMRDCRVYQEIFQSQVGKELHPHV